jgi:hypothetical protein
MPILNIFWPFCIPFCNFAAIWYSFPISVYCVKKDLATLMRSSNETELVKNYFEIEKTNHQIIEFENTNVPFPRKIFFISWGLSKTFFP